MSTFRYDAIFTINRAKWFDRLLAIVFGNLFVYEEESYYIIFMLNNKSIPVDINSANTALLKSIVQVYVQKSVDSYQEVSLSGVKVTGNIEKSTDGRVIKNLQRFEV
jgi:hypothetical protein